MLKPRIFGDTQMETSYILSDHGMVLSYEEGKIIQKPLKNILDFEDLVIIKNVGFGSYSIQIKNEEIFSFNSHLTYHNKAVDDHFIKFEYLDNKIVFFKINDNYLSSFPDSSINTLPEAITQEKFRILSEQELKRIIYLSQNSLLIDEKLYSFTSASTEAMNFGDMRIEFNDLFSDINKNITEFTFFIDNFPFFAKIINPLFVYVIFGNGDILSQFKMSIKSLVDVGKYKGDVLIVTDHEEEVQELCKDYNLRNVIIIQATATDRLDFVGIRVRMLASDIVKSYSPIFYIDADVLIVKDINPTLVKSSKFEKISAQLEDYLYFNNRIKHNISVGSTLFNECPFEINDVNGFNGGVLFVPSGEKFQDIFKTAYIMMVKYTHRNGRESIPFYEQSILNYILYKSNNFSPEPVSSITELSCEEVKKDAVFIHYFPAGGERTTHMKNYIKELGPVST